MNPPNDMAQIVPYLYYEDAGPASEFMEKAFGTHEVPERVSTMFYVYVDDLDEHHARAKAAGVRIWAEPNELFGGNRRYTASDPGGYHWTFAVPIDAS